MIRSETTFNIGKISKKFYLSHPNGHYLTATTKRIFEIESFRYLNSSEPVFILQLWNCKHKKITEIIIKDKEILNLIDLIFFNILQMNSVRCVRCVPNAYRNFGNMNIYSSFRNTQSFFTADNNGIHIKRLSNNEKILTITEKNNLKLKFLLWILNFIKKEVYESKEYILEKKSLLKNIGYNNLLIEKKNNIK